MLKKKQERRPLRCKKQEVRSFASIYCEERHQFSRQRDAFNFQCFIFHILKDRCADRGTNRIKDEGERIKVFLF